MNQRLKGTLDGTTGGRIDNIVHGSAVEGVVSDTYCTDCRGLKPVFFSHLKEGTYGNEELVGRLL